MNRIFAERTVAAIALAAALPIAAAPQKPAPPTAPIFELRVPVAEQHGPQDVNVIRREFPAGGSVGWHVHPGVEITYVLSGEMELQTEGFPPRRMRAGDHFVMQRGMAHNGVNVGKGSAQVMITLIIDRGAAIRTAVAAPE